MSNNAETQDWSDLRQIPRDFYFARADLTNFWLHSLPSIHNALTDIYSEIMNNHETSFLWLGEDLTLLAKTTETDLPQNYRPMTCLTTNYKILTSLITNRTYLFPEENTFFLKNKRGAKKWVM